MYKTLWTAVGMAKRANAEVLGTVVNITHMAFGDANGDNLWEPDQAMLALVHEVYRRPVDFVQVDEVHPEWVNVEGHILADDGGWWVREVGLFDADGDLVAIGNCAPRYKPLLAEGESTDQYFKLVLLTSNTAVITLKTNPAQALASR
jgi:phage-related tail fiber protein